MLLPLLRSLYLIKYKNIYKSPKFIIQISVKMRFTRLFSTVLLIALMSLFAFYAQAQNGTVRGKIYDDGGIEASFATVEVNELEATGATADLEGSFSLSLAPGTYSFSVSYVGFGDAKVSDIIVKPGDITVLKDIILGSTAEELEVVLVTAQAARNTSNSVMTLQKKSVNLLDGISVQAISQSGDSDAGAAIKRITGVTVENGKNVYVRGLGDRYTKTVLNGMEVPGLDPDRNTVQVDVFPANVLNNILVYKTFTPDLSGDFTGGTVDIELKKFPEEKIITYSGSVGYNSNTTFNDQYQTYESSVGDAFALGALSRRNPASELNIPVAITGATGVAPIVNSFSDEMSVDRATALPNMNFGYSWGNQFNLKNGRTSGLIFALNYRNSNNYYSDAIFDSYFKAADESQYELEVKELSSGEYSTNETLWSALVSGSIKNKFARHTLSLFHTQNGTKTASETMSRNYFSAEGTILKKDVLYYNQKSITSAVYENRINRPGSRFEFNTKISPSLSMNTEPDIRFTAFSVEEDGNGRITDYALQFGDGAKVSRIFRSLMEGSMNIKADATYKFQFQGRESRIKGGLAAATKYRDFSVVQYDFRDKGNTINLTGDPNQIFEDQNVFDATTNQGVIISGQSSPSNSYEAISNVAALYVMNELPLTSRLKTIYGARLEKTNIFYDGYSQGVTYDYENVLDELDILPSASLIYNAAQNMNIRMAYSRTLARPSFKEKSAAEIFDPITERRFIGNLDLRQTYIQNADLRWEYFFQPGEMVSLSGFYKGFKDPIEIVAYDENSPDDFTPRNVNSATVIGIELEARKNLGFIAPALNNLNIGTNFSYIKSEVERNEAEYQAALQEAKEGESISQFREMQGQSPFIINTTLNYAENGWNLNASYNVQGKRLSVVGIARVPHVFEKSFHSLNARLSKSFGIDNNWRVSLNAQNILNQKRQRVFESFQATDQVYESYNPGMSFSVGVGYAIRGQKVATTKLMEK